MLQCYQYIRCHHRAQGNFVKEKLQNALLVVRRYWQKPPKGQEVAYKEIAAKVIADGGSEADARRAVKAEKKARRDKKRAATKAMFDKLRADSKALNERKKQFCKEWIAAAKAEGKKKWLHVLAREAFSRQLAKEANEQSSDDAPMEAPTDAPTKSVAG